jgi:hypothetical protein
MNMKQILIIIAVFFTIGVSANAQTTTVKEVKIYKFDAKVVNATLFINWKSNVSDGTETYWEVQGSKDGKNFSTIGMVLGADPTADGSFKFKQTVAKLKPGFKYYRVLHIESADRAVASNTIGLSK